MAQTIQLPLGGKLRDFRLDLGGLEELQSACDAGPATIFARLMAVQPQAANTKRPNPDNYGSGVEDPDFVADFNTYALLRGIGGDWRIADVRETIRLGLIGGGMTPGDAFVNVSVYVDNVEKFPLTENVGLAAAILHHALTAPKGEEVGKLETGKVQTSTV
ncbi:gene transfer agent family protein [Agrobacterium larrymoorei]|uniref:Gene transfer agent family protein n=1 Tax=Agrobacterium larrymoorei TaxID=160699 RepID=A0ABU0UF60_9HYPH|nr:gene transfer agent family protein [Agrobacterium larrymoorei]MDQ1183582.1 hypothetical protein [Agrobacterium larrymoorei]